MTRVEIDRLRDLAAKRTAVPRHTIGGKVLPPDTQLVDQGGYRVLFGKDGPLHSEMKYGEGAGRDCEIIALLLNNLKFVVEALDWKEKEDNL